MHVNQTENLLFIIKRVAPFILLRMKHKYCEKFSALSGNFQTLIMSLSHWCLLSFLKYSHEINKFEVLCL